MTRTEFTRARRPGRPDPADGLRRQARAGPGQDRPWPTCSANAPSSSPSQLNALARDLLEGSFAQVWVQGEISNFSRPGSGHLYFTLKDDRAQVRCALFRQKAMLPALRAAATARRCWSRGKAHAVRGPRRIPAGPRAHGGSRRRRAARGLRGAEADAWPPKACSPPSASARCRASSRRLGLITSPARRRRARRAVSVLARRFPLLEVDVLPVPVQGQGAAAEIRAMLDRAIASGRYDALLLARGGGSLEDLWSLQRRGAGARDRRLADPDRVGGRPRDRFQPGRFRRRPARAHALGRG